MSEGSSIPVENQNPAASAATLTPEVAPPAPAPEPIRGTPDPATGEFLGVGRRKTAVARVRIRPNGKGQVLINGRAVEEFFPVEKQRVAALSPLVLTGQQNQVDIRIRVQGGGITGQGDACKLGIARALVQYDRSLEPALRDGNMLTRDSRMVERKKYGLRKARRGTQFSKR